MLFGLHCCNCLDHGASTLRWMTDTQLFYSGDRTFKTVEILWGALPNMVVSHSSQ
jgi:hypothetical protein